MSKSKQKPTMTEVLKAAIDECGLTQYKIAQDTGILATSLGRFMRAKPPYGSIRPTCWPSIWGWNW